MTPLITLLVQRYLSHATAEQTISTMVKISFLGIFLGSLSLALVTAINNGFKTAIDEKMRGIHSHAIIRSTGSPLNSDAIKRVLNKEFPAVECTSPTSYGYVLIPSGPDNIPNVMLLRAINPETEQQVSNLGEKLLSQHNQPITTLSDALKNNSILIGKTSAQNSNTRVGDTLTLLFPENQGEDSANRRISLLTHKTEIGGIFQTGIEEFDAGVIFCTFDLFNELFPESGVAQLNVKFKPATKEKAVIEQLRERLNLDVYSWKELYPALVSALLLEQYAMFIVIALITLVASMNIISLLFTQITYKRGDIAILRVMGASEKIISAIFVFMGMSIALIAALCGIAAAWIIAFFFTRYPCITLPDVYYVSHLPIAMSFRISIAVFTVVAFLSFLASWLPTRRLKTMNLATILRNDA